MNTAQQSIVDRITLTGRDVMVVDGRSSALVHAFCVASGWLIACVARARRLVGRGAHEPHRPRAVHCGPMHDSTCSLSTLSSCRRVRSRRPTNGSDATQRSGTVRKQWLDKSGQPGRTIVMPERLQRWSIGKVAYFVCEHHWFADGRRSADKFMAKLWGFMGEARKAGTPNTTDCCWHRLTAEEQEIISLTFASFAPDPWPAE